MFQMSFRNLFFPLPIMETCVIRNPECVGFAKADHRLIPLCSKMKQELIRPLAESKLKTEIISTVNHLDNTSEYCPEKGKEIIPENLVDTCEFLKQSAPSSKDNRDLYDYDTQNVLG